MNKMMKKFEELAISAYCYVRSQKGQGMVEYALILGLVVVGAIVALTTLGTNVKGLINNVAQNVK